MRTVLDVWESCVGSFGRFVLNNFWRNGRSGKSLVWKFDEISVGSYRIYEVQEDLSDLR